MVVKSNLVITCDAREMDFDMPKYSTFDVAY